MADRCCYFCKTSPEKIILNTCPKCNVSYCSQKCYQNPQHLQCTESFYRECVEQELRGTKAENSREFIDKLRRQMENNDEDGFDSDDDEDDNDETNDNGEDLPTPSYLKQLEKLNFEEIDEDELDKQLESMGVGHDPNSLINLLNETEKKFLENFMNKTK